MSTIPESARLAVKSRDNLRCCRCGTPVAPGEWHHRRSRRVVDKHQHHPCNGVLLCPTCHRWVHAHPLLARLSGFIISMHETDPSLVPISTVWGQRFHDCEGNYAWTEEELSE